MFEKTKKDEFLTQTYILAEPRLVTKLMKELGLNRGEAEVVLDTFMRQHV